MSDKPKRHVAYPECRTQAQQDRIEQRYMHDRNPGMCAGNKSDAADDYQTELWRRKIWADIVAFDPEKMTCKLVGNPVQTVKAKAALLRMGVKAKLT